MVVLGLAGFILTGSTHYTALIPTGFGVVFMICGWIALNPFYLKHSMHLASVIALLGVFGSIGGLLQVFKLFSGQAVARPPAVIAQSIMSLVCIAFLGLAIGSFIQARRLRRVAGNS